MQAVNTMRGWRAGPDQEAERSQADRSHVDEIDGAGDARLELELANYVPRRAD